MVKDASGNHNPGIGQGGAHNPAAAFPRYRNRSPFIRAQHLNDEVTARCRVGAKGTKETLRFSNGQYIADQFEYQHLPLIDVIRDR